MVKKSRSTGFGFDSQLPELAQRFLTVLILVDGKAGHQLATIVLQLRLKLGTWAEATTAAGVKRAARRRIQRARQLPGQLDALAAVIRIQARRCRQQRLSVRMLRVVEDLILRPFFHAAA